MDKKVNDDTLIGTLHDEDYNKLKQGIENRVAQKINGKIQEKKKEIIENISGIKY